MGFHVCVFNTKVHELLFFYKIRLWRKINLGRPTTVVDGLCYYHYLRRLEGNQSYYCERTMRTCVQKVLGVMIID